MTKQNALKLAATVAMGVSIVTLTACEKKQEQPVEAEIKVVEPVVQEIEAVCDEPSLRNRLVDAIQAGLLDSALLSIQNYDDATRLGLEQQVRQKLGEIDIELQNVAASGATCRADVHITLPAQDIAYANKTFELTNQLALDEQAAEAGAALVGGNRLMSKGFAYTIDNNKAIIGTDNAIVNLVANTLVASAHSMAGESRTNAQNAPTVRLEPTQPIAAPRIQPRHEEQPTRQAPEPVRTDAATRPAERTEPVRRPEPLPRPSETAKPKAEQPKQQAPKQQAPKEQAPRAEAPKPKAQPQPAAKPAESAPAPKPVADDNVELTIVESNETY